MFGGGFDWEGLAVLVLGLPTISIAGHRATCSNCSDQQRYSRQNPALLSLPGLFACAIASAKAHEHNCLEDVDNVGSDATRRAGEIFIEQGIQLESKPAAQVI